MSVDTKITCKSMLCAVTCQFWSFPFANHAGTHMCPHACVKYKLFSFLEEMLKSLEESITNAQITKFCYTAGQRVPNFVN